MNITGIALFLFAAWIIGKVVRSVQQSQVKRNAQNGQTPSIPYQENRPEATAAHESAAKPRVWRGVDSFREMLEQLEAASEGRETKDPSVNFAQAFEKPATAPKPRPRQGEGIASTEGTVSTQGMPSTEGIGTQGTASLEGIGSFPAHAAQASAASGTGQRMARGYFSDTADLRRAIVISEVLGKPVSLRRKRAV